jgi:hypothetical protein
LDDPSDSQDKKAEIVHVGTTRTNAVDCGDKTVAVCAVNKRGSCSQIANTCGGCIGGFIGNPQGPGNDPCIIAPVKASILRFTGNYIDNP